MSAFEKLNQWLTTEAQEAILVTKPENIGYLTGFWGSFGMYLQTQSGGRYLLTDGRYAVLATKLALKNNFKFICFKGEAPADFIQAVKADMCIEDTLSLAELSRLKKWFAGVDINVKTGVIEQFRKVKTAAELQIMREAQAHVDKILLPFIKANLKTGVSEAQLKFKLDQVLRGEGKFGLSFESIVGFSEGSALPHYESGERTLKIGDNILIDCGVIDRKYCSDMTRNFVFGSVDKSYIEDYAMLLQSQNKTLQQVKTGVKACDLDLACRSDLGDLADLFVHSLGHGVGLEIHEAPTLSKKSEDILQTNEVVTVEPGIYRPNQYGIRIEDSLVVLPDGAEILTKTTKELLSFDEAGNVQVLVP